MDEEVKAMETTDLDSIAAQEYAMAVKVSGKECPPWAELPASTRRQLRRIAALKIQQQEESPR